MTACFDIYDNNSSEKHRQPDSDWLGSGKMSSEYGVCCVWEKHPEQFHQFRSLFRIGHRFTMSFGFMVVTDPGLNSWDWIKLKIKGSMNKNRYLLFLWLTLLIAELAILPC